MAIGDCLKRFLEKRFPENAKNCLAGRENEGKWTEGPENWKNARKAQKIGVKTGSLGPEILGLLPVFGDWRMAKKIPEKKIPLGD